LVEARARFVEPRAHPPKSGAWCGKQKAKEARRRDVRLGGPW